MAWWCYSSGRVSIMPHCLWQEPRDRTNPSDVAASELSMTTQLGWIAQPVYGDGDYPQQLKDMIAKLSEKRGLQQSTLPEFTAEEKALNKGRCWLSPNWELSWSQLCRQWRQIWHHHDSLFNIIYMIYLLILFRLISMALAPVPVELPSLKRKGRQGDSPCLHRRRWRQASTSPMNTRAVTLMTFPCLCRRTWINQCSTVSSQSTTKCERCA